MSVSPTSVDTKARAKAESAISRYGRTLVLRKPIRTEILTGANAGKVAASPLSTSSVLADGTLASGSPTVGLRAAVLTGLLVAGDTIVFDSHSTVYTVTGGPYAAASNAVAAASVTPNLSEEVPDGTPATITFAGTDSTIKGVCSQIDYRFVDGEKTKAGDWQILVASKFLDDLGVSVEEGDDLFLGDNPSTARVAEIVKTSAIPSGEQDAAVWLFARLR